MNLSVSLHFQLPVNLCVKLSINAAVHQSDCPSIILSINQTQQQLFNQLATGNPPSPIAARSYVVIITWRCCPSVGKGKVREVGGAAGQDAARGHSQLVRSTGSAWLKKRKQLCWANGANRMRQIQLRLVLPATRLRHARDTTMTRSPSHSRMPDRRAGREDGDGKGVKVVEWAQFCLSTLQNK